MEVDGSNLELLLLVHVILTTSLPYLNHYLLDLSHFERVGSTHVYVGFQPRVADVEDMSARDVAVQRRRSYPYVYMRLMLNVFSW